MPPTSLLDATPALAAFAEIALPPDTTLPQFVSLQSSLVTSTVAVAVAFGVLICDHLHLLPHEIRLYQTRSKGLWRSPATWAFVLLRYSGILATFPALFLESVPNKYCQPVALSSQVGVVLVIASSGLIFGARVTALWGGHKAIYAVVAVLYTTMLASWCAVVSQYRMESAPPVPFGSNCHMRPFVSWAPIAHASSLAFDAALLLLAAISPARRPRTSAAPPPLPAEHTTARPSPDPSSMYLLTTAAANAIALALHLLAPHLAHVRATSAPLASVITVAMAARTYLRLLHPPSTPHPPPGTRAPPRGIGTYPCPATPPHSPRAATPNPKPHDVEFFALDVPVRPDTPFGSYDYDYDYDYDTPKATAAAKFPVFTRETVVAVE